MAKRPTDLQAIGRQVATPTQTIQPNRANENVGKATAELAGMLSNAFQSAAIEQAATTAEQDVLQGVQPQKLAPSIGKATSAYNKSVVETETRMIVNQGRHMLSEAYTKASDPAKFNTDSPAKFDAEVEGIIEGIIKAARPETQASVATELKKSATTVQTKMLDDAIAFDNKQAILTFDKDVETIRANKREAILTGDTESAQMYEKELQQAFDNWGAINQQIAQKLPEIKKQNKLADKIDGYLYEFLQASENDQEAEWLYNFQTKKPTDLTFKEWDVARKEVLEQFRLQARMTAEAETEQAASVDRLIKDGTIQNQDDIWAYGDRLSFPQKMKAIDLLEQVQSQKNKKSIDGIEMQRDILLGRTGLISSEKKNSYFKDTLAAQEQLLGRPLSLFEMSRMITGETTVTEDGKEIQPLSGANGFAFNSNVPAFDNMISSRLKIKDNPAVQAEAIAIYNYMANTMNQPSSINLSGEALDIATLGASLMLSGTELPTDVAKQVSDTVLNVSTTDREERSSRFNSTKMQKDLPNKYKEVFGTMPRDFQTDGAYRLFKNTYRIHYLNSSSEEAALASTKSTLRNWGESKYGPKGYVMNSPPEKELAIIKDFPQAFDNQLTVALQLIINNNKKDREAGITSNVIEWADTKDSIENVYNLPDTDKALKNLRASSDEQFLMLGIGPVQTREARKLGKPKIKINGRETEVDIMSGPGVRLGPQGQNTYDLYYTDRFGNLTNIPDPGNSTSGVAQFTPQEMINWAPEIFNDANNKEVSEIMRRAQQSQMENIGRQNLAKSDVGKLYKYNPLFSIPTNALIKIIAKMEAGKISDERLDEAREILRARRAGEQIPSEEEQP